MIAQNPETSPSTFLMDNSFAAWCYDNKTLAWLKAAFNRDADPDYCKKWMLSPAEWRVNIEIAIIALGIK